MKIKTEIAKLKEMDVYSLMLFALYKIKDIPEFSTLSEMAYVLDKDNLLKLCEYFGGLTIKIPTVEELQSIIYALVLYQYVDIDGMSMESAIKIIGHQSDELRQIRADYRRVKEVLAGYDFTPRQKDG
jgi:hypothetical protein